MAKTNIEWSDMVWNPIAGCNDVSEGCRNCYARTMAKRLEAMGLEKYKGLTVLQGSKTVWTGKISFDKKALLAPLDRKTPTRYFVNSMSDLFHENVTDDMQDQIFAVAALCPQHEFYVLTKRPKQMFTYVRGIEEDGVFHEGFRSALVEGMAQCIQVTREPSDRDSVSEWLAVSLPLKNVRLGVSVENQKAADDRLDYLCALAEEGWGTMVSFEPLLGAVDPGTWWLSLGSQTWAIVGGESGPGARPMHPDWARSLRDQCGSAGVPFFFKQWGDLAPGAQQANYSRAGKMYTRIDVLGNPSNDPTRWSATDALFYKVGKKAAGRLLDGREWNEMPEVQ